MGFCPLECIIFEDKFWMLECTVLQNRGSTVHLFLYTSLWWYLPKCYSKSLDCFVNYRAWLFGCSSVQAYCIESLVWSLYFGDEAGFFCYLKKITYQEFSNLVNYYTHYMSTQNRAGHGMYIGLNCITISLANFALSVGSKSSLCIDAGVQALHILYVILYPNRLIYLIIYIWSSLPLFHVRY
jgi:hypothetical protein